MINTKNLVEGEKVIVLLDDEDMILCKFINGVFQNIEDTHHKNEIYASSVIKYKKIKFANCVGDEK